MSKDNLELSRRKILGSVGAVGAAGAAAGLGTSALFSDEESFENNSITAGTLDMTVDARIPDGAINDEWAGAVGFTEYDPDTADGQPGVGVSLDDMKPGDWVLLCYEIEVQDNPACLGLKTENTANDENSVTEPEADTEADISGSLSNPNTSADTTADIDGEGELAQRLDVTVYDDFDDSVAINGDLSNAQSALSNELLGGVTLQDVWSTFSGGDAIADNTNAFDFYVLLELPTETGNEVQSDSVKWDFVFDAVQSRNTDNDPYGNACDPVWSDDCTPECPSPTNPDPGTDDFGVTIETIDKSAFPTVEVTTRVDTTAGGNGNIPDGNFSIDESTPNGIGTGFCGQTIESVTFGGQQQETLADVMFVIDNSGSMSGSKIQNAREGAIELVGGDADTTNDATQGGFDPTVNVGLVSYTDTANTRATLGTDQNTVENEMSQLSGFNGTDLGEGISAANEQFFTDPNASPPDFSLGPNNRSNAPDFMIVLGNGDTSGGKAPADDAKNNGVTIFGIAYGSGASVSDFSEISGEEPSDPDYQDFTFDADTDDITDIFQQIGEEIFGTYTIEYETANCEEDGLDRNVEVYVDDPNAGDADATGSYVAPN
ncbi:VWA domain-containing protein [Halorubrum sp. SS5]|nr:VWA domain-containing protein [Halorubrum sp. SS5]